VQLYIYRNNNQSGPHDEEVIKGQLQSGGLSPTDLGCKVGDTEWLPLGEMYPEAIPQVATDTTPAVVGPVAKKGGCLRTGLITLGLMGLVLGILIGVGSRFIPSVSCSLYEEDSHHIDKLRLDLDKAKQDADLDRVSTLQFELSQDLSGAEASRKNCEDDKFRNNVVGIAGILISFIGLLMTVIGLFIGRRT
jgi:hypothetical protein